MRRERRIVARIRQLRTMQLLYYIAYTTAILYYPVRTTVISDSISTCRQRSTDGLVMLSAAIDRFHGGYYTRCAANVLK